MDDICLFCRARPTAKNRSLCCSKRCQRRLTATRAAGENKELRRSVITEGFSLSEQHLYAEAQKAMLFLDERAFYYRLILDVVDGKPSRVRFDPETLDPKCRSIVFPEPNRATHVDAKGFRRKGDFFELRSTFEYPAVPVAAFYRVKLLGPCVRGEPLEYDSRSEGDSELYVNLPASPFHSSEWKSARWGSTDQAAHRLRQQARRGEDPQQKYRRMVERAEQDGRRQVPNSTSSETASRGDKEWTAEQEELLLALANQNSGPLASSEVLRKEP